MDSNDGYKILSLYDELSLADLKDIGLYHLASRSSDIFGWIAYKKYSILSMDEWEYVNAREGKAVEVIVGGFKGRALLPDTWNVSLSKTEFTPYEWEAMEAAGAVFLPYLGRAKSSGIAYIHEHGDYMTSSNIDDSLFKIASFVDYGVYLVNPNSTAYPRCSVRLVVVK